MASPTHEGHEGHVLHEGQGKPGVLHTVHGVTDRYDLVTEQQHFIMCVFQMKTMRLMEVFAT